MILKRLSVLISLLLTCPMLFSCKAKTESIKVPSDVVLDIHTTQSEELWIGTADGIAHFGATSDQIPLPETSKHVWGVATDSKGIPWLATANGIFLYSEDKKSFTNIVDDIVASTIAIDATDTAWVGTQGYGVAKITDKYLVNWYKTSDGLPSNTILSILSSDDGSIWAGTDEGLAVLERDLWKTEPFLEGRQIFEIAEYLGFLIVGTDDGAFIQGKNEWQRFPETEGKVVTASQLFQDSLLLATKNAELIVYPFAQFTGDLSSIGLPTILSYNEAGLSNDVITSIGVREDVLLFGAFGGGVRMIPSDNWESLFSSGP